EVMCLASNQKYALAAYQNAWRDKSLARVRSGNIILTRHEDTEAPNNSCLLIKTDKTYKIIPVDKNGNRGQAMTVDPESDIAEIAQKIPDYAFSNSEKQISQDSAVVQRLLRAIRGLNKRNLDQKSLAAKANLDKDIRHRVKLGLVAFSQIYNNSLSFSEALESRIENGDKDKDIKKDEIRYKILAGEFSKIDASPETYIVIKPTVHKDGCIYFVDAQGKKSLLKDEVILKALRKIRKADLQTQGWNERFNLELKKLILDYYFRQLDRKAHYAIKNYKTRWQKLTTIFGNILAALTAFAYGTVELVATMLGFFVAAGVVWTSPLLATVGVLLLAAAIILPIPTTWADWKTFSTYVPGFFNNIRKEYNEINSPLKKGLFWALSFFAIATGIAAGGLAYTSAIALPAMIGLGAAGIIFPPLGIFLAAAVTLCQAFSMIRSFTKLLRKENSWKEFKRPFKEVSNILRDSNAGWGRRIITWIVVGGLTVLSILGLMMSCFTSTRSVG
ncbi:MAG TPA: hypothetical protein VHA13_05845, partial [Gammaproteobacteria bacterium]|nr:hypothetical protein [Gammaproteobacteria bacterium]